MTKALGTIEVQYKNRWLIFSGEKIYDEVGELIEFNVDSVKIVKERFSQPAQEHKEPVWARHRSTKDYMKEIRG